MGTRMTTYPVTISCRSTWSPSTSDSNILGRPRASTSTPAICTIVVSRKIQSSVS